MSDTISASEVGRDTLAALARDTQVDVGARCRAAEVLFSQSDPLGRDTLIALAQDGGVDCGVRVRAAEVLAATVMPDEPMG